MQRLHTSQNYTLLFTKLLINSKTSSIDYWSGDSTQLIVNSSQSAAATSRYPPFKVNPNVSLGWEETFVHVVQLVVVTEQQLQTFLIPDHRPAGLDSQRSRWWSYIPVYIQLKLDAWPEPLYWEILRKKDALDNLKSTGELIEESVAHLR